MSLAARSWRRGIVAALTLLAAWQIAASGDPLMYVVEGDAVVFTNTPVHNARPVPGLADADGGRNAASDRLPVTIYDPYIERVARENGLSAALIKAVALVESGFNPHAVSRAGAQGLMQLMPQTAQEYGVSDAFDPLANLRAGALHLRSLLDEFEGDLTLALAAYNAGSSTVRSHNGVPDFPETVDYVSKVHEKLGRRPRGLPGGRKPVRAERPIRFTILEDGSVLLSN